MSKLDFLKNLGLEKQNSGVSTGTEWLNGYGSLIESFSPADGSVIAHVRNANLEDYETVISLAQDSFRNGVKYQHRSVEKSCVRLEMQYVKQRMIWEN